jgi:hypothetical protein
MPLDYSPLLGQIPESPTSRGLTFIGDALDAVMERRRKVEAERLEREAMAAAEKARLGMQGDYYKALVAGQGAARAETARHNLASEEISRGNMGVAQQRAHTESQRKALDAALFGAPDVAKAITSYSAPAAPAPVPRPMSQAALTPTLGEGILLPSFVPDPAAASIEARQAPPVAPPSVKPEIDYSRFSPEAVADRLAQLPDLPERIKALLPELRVGTKKTEDIMKAIREERRLMSNELNAERAARTSGQSPYTPAEHIRLSTAADSLLNSITRRTDYVKELESFKNIQGMLNEFASDNPALQKSAAGKWAKEKSGPGTVQLQERHEFVNSIGGIDEAFKKKILEWISSGEIPEDQLQFFIRAVRDYELPRQQQRMSGISRLVRRASERHPLPAMRDYAAWAEDQIQSRIAGGPATDQDVDDLLSDRP